MAEPDSYVREYEYQVPIFVVLGGGLRLLENLDSERLELEKIRVQEVGARTSLSFRVKRLPLNASLRPRPSRPRRRPLHRR